MGEEPPAITPDEHDALIAECIEAESPRTRARADATCAMLLASQSWPGDDAAGGLAFPPGRYGTLVDQ